MNHATVEVSGFKIPLIGVPSEATLEECDRCHDAYPLTQVTWTERGWLCQKCNSKKTVDDETTNE